PGPSTNTAPTVPTLGTPTNGQLCIDNNLSFTWNASTDAEGDTIKYTIEVSRNDTFTQITHSFNNLEAPTRTILLERGIIYYWR
ncbi:hypothetical protein, partial [Allotamlana fucoidanivorans]